MNVNMKRIIWGLMAIAAVSCTELSESLTETGEQIVFSKNCVEAEVQTKQSVSSVTSLSEFYVNCVVGSPGVSEQSVFNTKFSGEDRCYGNQYWPSTDAGYKFYAANAVISPKATGPVLDASVAVNTVDIVTAVCLDAGYKMVNQLAFNHIFARIGSCAVSAPDKYTVSELSVSIVPKVSGEYDILAGNGKTDGTGWSRIVEGNPVVIANAVASSSDNGLYLVPGQYSVAVEYTLVRGAYSEHFSKTSKPFSVSGGKVNNISLTLPEGNAVEIGLSVTVTPWVQGNVITELL